MGGDTAALVFNGILNGLPAAASSIRSDLPPGLAGIIDKALRKDRKLRYQSAAEPARTCRLFAKEGEPVGSATRAPLTWIFVAAGVVTVVAAMAIYCSVPFPNPRCLVFPPSLRTDWQRTDSPCTAWGAPLHRWQWMQAGCTSSKMSPVRRCWPKSRFAAAIRRLFRHRSACPSFSIFDWTDRNCWWRPGNDARSGSRLDNRIAGRHAAARGGYPGKRCRVAPRRIGIAYVSGHDLFRASKDGTNTKLLSRLPGTGWRPRWSPDGKRLRLT